MTYTKQERDLIVADALAELTYLQKKLFLASVNRENAQSDKYAEELIKKVGVGVYNNAKEKFYDEDFRKKTVAFLEKRSVVALTWKSENYPEQLRPLPAPPLVLYARGNVSLLNDRLFGVVGSRKTNAAMTEQCKKFCSSLTNYFTLVTGVADGADTVVARSALPSGRIICVLPSGHDASGAANFRTLREVEEKGLTLSEFPPKVRAQRHTFVLRNRLLAGLCEGLLVVSGDMNSGALSTAGFANDYSKELFAFPYCPDIVTGEGCNDLIKHGAYLCDRVEDIYSVLGVNDGETEESISLSDEEKSVYKLLKEEGEMHAVKLAQVLGKNLTDVVITCSMLEIKGVIIKVGGNSYAALK